MALTPRLVPWASWEEWDDVRRGLMGEGGPLSREGAADAIQRVSVQCPKS